jgi:hypothetical protein
MAYIANVDVYIFHISDKEMKSIITGIFLIEIFIFINFSFPVAYVCVQVYVWFQIM